MGQKWGRNFYLCSGQPPNRSECYAHAYSEEPVKTRRKITSALLAGAASMGRGRLAAALIMLYGGKGPPWRRLWIGGIL